MSDRSLYLRAAEDLRGNAGQWEAYESEGHCVVLAGPGSGKTKTLTIKLARLLFEEIEEPRGLACITYNNETARELETRLYALGVEPGRRVFIGTVHSFSLTQIILPYAKTAKLGLPDEFSVATKYQQRAALETAYKRVIGGPGNPQDSFYSMGRYRRSILNRDSKQWREQDPQLARLVEEYEAELRKMQVIDFDDMPLLAVKALRENEWLQRAVYAKYPVLAVDEYQDLGRALHRMVLGLCFSAGMRLFAVGDVDQSIYGFTGAYPELLQQLSEREDVQTVRLRLNYRCGSRIVTASEYALGEDRGYEAPEGAAEGTIYFHPCTGNYDEQAGYVFSTLIPEAKVRIPELTPGKIAILYPAAWIGDAVATAAQEYGFGVVRSDTNALYPRASRLMRWLEGCAAWCCGGWKTGNPRFARLVREGQGLFAEVLRSDEDRRRFRRNLLKELWSRRNGTMNVHDWLVEMRTNLIADLVSQCRTQDDEGVVLEEFIERTGPTGDVSDMSLDVFAGFGDGGDRLNLSTLHSAKGREFAVVILFGMDEGRIPRNGASDADIKESRRLFYVGFTRAEDEVHMVYSSARPSRFVTEVQKRIAED
ncbi:MAG: ATP-dependent helicase [Pseudomonadota bacterium]